MGVGMRVGLVVDGQAEFRSLKLIYDRIKTNNQFFGPLYADIQPNSKPGKIAAAAMPSIQVLARKGASRVLIILDHENRNECVPYWKTQLEEVICEKSAGLGIEQLMVILKVEMYENWLLSDPSAMKKKKARFDLSAGDEKKINKRNADNLDALGVIKKSTIGSSYSKIDDAVGIMSHFDPYKAAVNSRSFRRFLRLMGCQDYCHQSKKPK